MPPETYPFPTMELPTMHDALTFFESTAAHPVDHLIAQFDSLDRTISRADAGLVLMREADYDRFARNVDYDLEGDGCWTWTGGLDSQGYGMACIHGESVRAHRVALRLVDDLPPGAGLVADHVCHNRDLSCAGGPSCPHRRCVRPDHLALVTRDVNGRTGRGGAAQAARTQCPAGHAYDGSNLRINSRGHRVCRVCEAAAQRRYRAKRRQSRGPNPDSMVVSGVRSTI